MEKYFKFTDRTTARCPFDERIPTKSSWKLTDRIWSYVRGTVVAPLLIVLRAPFVLYTVFLWYIVSFITQSRAMDKLFSRVLLILFGFYRVPAYKISKTKRIQQPFNTTSNSSLVFGRLGTPTDLLIYIFYFSPVAVHVPWYTSNGDLVHRLEKAVKAFILFSIYDQRFRRAENLAGIRPADFEASITCDSSAKMLSKLSRFGPKATLLFFPECSLTNGRVVLKSVIDDIIDKLIHTKKPVLCVSVENYWKYRSVVHPFPDLMLLAHDLGEPKRCSSLYVATPHQDKAFTHENIMEGLSLAANTPRGEMTASNRYLYLQKAREQRNHP